jgi:hypothetical protein
MPVSEKRGDITYIKEPLHILCYDWVIHPSHKPAYMEKIVSESANPFGLSESYFIPLTESDISSFLKDESKNVKQLTEQFNFQDSSLLGIGKKKKNNLVYFKEGADILAIYLEDYINYDLDRYLSKL